MKNEKINSANESKIHTVYSREQIHILTNTLALTKIQHGHARNS
jgi:hypothetical protein